MALDSGDEAPGADDRSGRGRLSSLKTLSLLGVTAFGAVSGIVTGIVASTRWVSAIETKIDGTASGLVSLRAEREGVVTRLQEASRELGAKVNDMHDERYEWRTKIIADVSGLNVRLAVIEAQIRMLDKPSPLPLATSIRR